MAGRVDAPAQIEQAQSRPRARWLAATGAAGLCFLIYLYSLAPGLTWAHQGADGGDFLAAAVVGGVPHPPGYPLYMLLLQGWIALLGALAPASDLAWRGNLLSALFGACSVFVTVLTAGALLDENRRRWLWAGLAGLLWGVTPLLWGQAIITEVYTLHAAIVALLGWATLAQSERRLWPLAIPVALGSAHHFTFLLLLPAVLFAIWAQNRTWRKLASAVAWMIAGMAIGAIFYARIPLAADRLPPVNWGYATDLAGLWWLVSGAAYKDYLFSTPASSVVARIAAWAYTLAIQYTLAGFALALWGLSHWDQKQAHLRTFSLLWLIPMSIYSIGYNTRDSDVYLLPVVWLMSLWLAVGIDRCARWVAGLASGRRVAAAVWIGAGIVFAATLITRWQSVSLRDDRAARDFVTAAAGMVEPNAILVSRGDAETFALWYGTWASGELARAAPGLVVVNDALYQFDWYARLQAALHPDVAGAGESAEALIEANAGSRPIYVTETSQNEAAANQPAEPRLYRIEPPQ